MALRLYPIGIQTFERIRKENKLYIDKTEYICKKELFEGLAMEKLEQDWTEYPVLHFDMSGSKYMEKEQLEDYLLNRLAAEEKKWGITNPPQREQMIV